MNTENQINLYIFLVSLIFLAGFIAGGHHERSSHKCKIEHRCKPPETDKKPFLYRAGKNTMKGIITGIKEGIQGEPK